MTKKYYKTEEKKISRWITDRSEGVMELAGSDPGPVSVILAGVHGDEICGVKALEKVLPVLRIDRGKVFFIIGNPASVRRGVRFLDNDLNRMFRDDKMLRKEEKRGYEYERARFIKKYLDQAGALLDIHASSISRSRSFIICEKNAFSIAKHIPVKSVVSGFDRAEPGGADYYMNMKGRVGICLECGGRDGVSSSETARQSIYSFLRAVGHIGSRVRNYKQSYKKINTIYLARTDNFVLAKQFMDFERIRKGQIIGTDGKKDVIASDDCFIIFAHSRNNRGEEAFLLGRS